MSSTRCSVDHPKTATAARLTSAWAVTTARLRRGIGARGRRASGAPARCGPSPRRARPGRRRRCSSAQGDDHRQDGRGESRAARRATCRAAAVTGAVGRRRCPGTVISARVMPPERTATTTRVTAVARGTSRAGVGKRPVRWVDGLPSGEQPEQDQCSGRHRGPAVRCDRGQPGRAGRRERPAPGRPAGRRPARR